MSKRPIDEDASARKRATPEPQLADLPAELIEMIARTAGPSGYRNLAQTCRRARQVLTLDAARQERAKEHFSKLDVRVRPYLKDVVTCIRLPNGLIHGAASYRSTVSGNLVGIEHWVDARMHGVEERWYESGQRKTRREWVAGMLTGTEESWSEDGVLVEHTPYKMGRRLGFAFTWYLDGSLRTRCYYHNGKRYGLDEKWDAMGLLMQRGNYQHDKRHGTYEEWVMGVLVNRTHYIDGVACGLMEHWWPNGNPRSHVVAVGGAINGKFTAWSRDGILIHSADYLIGVVHGDWVDYNDAGILIRRIQYERGAKHGLLERWNDDGSRKHTKTYAHGKIHGMCEKWTDGALVYRAYYANNKLHGSVYEWATDGSLISYSTWTNGVMDA